MDREEAFKLLQQAAWEAINVGPGCNGECPRRCKHMTALEALENALVEACKA